LLEPQEEAAQAADKGAKRHDRPQSASVDRIVSPSPALRRQCTIGLRSSVRFGLLDLFDTQQHLVFGQRLRPAAEAMPRQRASMPSAQSST